MAITAAEAARNQEVARTILNQLGGMSRLRAMTGAYNFVALGNGVSFRVKSHKGANYFKIVLTSKDLYDVEAGRIHGEKYTILATGEGYYDDMLIPFVEKNSGMYLSMARGGQISSADKRAKRTQAIDTHKAELKRLKSMNADELAGEYEAKHGLPGHHHDYNTLLAALYYGKRIKHLTDKERESARKLENGGKVNKSASKNTPLTKENVERGLSIISKGHPDWGTWGVLRKYDEGIWEIRGRSGDRVLNEDEFSHWEIVEGNNFKKGGIVESGAIESIARNAGIRPAAVESYITNNNLDAVKMAQDIGTKKLNIIDVITAVTGETHNRYSQEIISKYQIDDKKESGGTVDIVGNLYHVLYTTLDENGRESDTVYAEDVYGTSENNVREYYHLLYPDTRKIDNISVAYEKGGHIGFKALSKKVAKNYEGKPVPPKYQKEYGATYSKAEAQEVGNKVAAKVARIKGSGGLSAARKAANAMRLKAGKR